MPRMAILSTLAVVKLSEGQARRKSSTRKTAEGTAMPSRRRNTRKMRSNSTAHRYRGALPPYMREACHATAPHPQAVFDQRRVVGLTRGAHGRTRATVANVMKHVPSILEREIPLK